MTHPHSPAAARVAQLFAWPILIASLATVVGLMLSITESAYAEFGETLVMLGAVVVMVEPVALWVVTPDKWRWFREHRALILLGAAVLVVFVVGVAVPLHLLRLLQTMGSSQFVHLLSQAKLLKVGELTHAKEHIDQVSPISKRWRSVLDAIILVLVPVYVFLVLRDPEGPSRQLLRELEVQALAHPRLLLLAAALLVVVVVGRSVKAKHASSAVAS